MEQSTFDEIERLADAGFALLPLGGDGKQPLVKFQDKPISVGQVAAIMTSQGSSTYGVRLPDLAVVDVDDLSEELYDIVNKRCGISTVQTDTSRGRHFYFENPHGIRHNFRKEGIPIDFKTGLNSYVVGPLSQRPDGAIYRPMQGVLGIDPLPIIVGPPQALITASEAVNGLIGSDQVMEGGRHDHLTKKAVKFGHTSKTEDELLANLMYERDIWCAAGNHPVSDSEVVEIANWAWSKLLSGDLWGGERILAMKAKTVETLTRNPDGGVEAFVLYSILKIAHPFPDKRFALNFGGMKKAGLVTFGEGKFYKAKNLLQQEDFIELMANYSVGNRSNQYRLTRR